MVVPLTTTLYTGTVFRSVTSPSDWTVPVIILGGATRSATIIDTNPTAAAAPQSVTSHTQIFCPLSPIRRMTRTATTHATARATTMASTNGSISRGICTSVPTRVPIRDAHRITMSDPAPVTWGPGRTRAMH